MNVDLKVVQINPTVGDIQGNTHKIIDSIPDSRECLIVTPELSVVGYPPQDLVYRNELYKAQNKSFEEISDALSSNQMIVVGAVRKENSFLYNSALVIDENGIQHEYRKQLLPTYDVFDECRYFRSGDEDVVFEYDGYTIGLTICEDAWFDAKPEGVRQHTTDPIENYSEYELDVLLNLSASPFRSGKPDERVDRFGRHSTTIDAPVVFANQVGANDELVFDGNSVIMNGNDTMCRLAGFEEDEISLQDGLEDGNSKPSTNIRETVKAVEMGIKDYFDKTGSETAIIGMSGGIDSSVAALLTKEALGPENVIGISLPSTVSSQSSINDARTVAENLGIEFQVLPIGSYFTDIEDKLENEGHAIEGITRENIQARIRGLVLMTLSNSVEKALVITPDNKSEGAVGYCTLYGDTVGAIAPLGDLYKENVYKIAEFYNERYDAIPNNVIDKEPTAELKEDQEDSDDIPQYKQLDEFLDQYINNSKPLNETDTSLSSSEIENVVQRIHRSEFKRNQSPIIIRVSDKDLSLGWRYPIAADYSFITNNRSD